MKKSSVRSITAAAAVAIALTVNVRDAAAIPLAPGGAVVPTILAGDPGTLIDFGSETDNGSTFVATVTFAVFRNSGGFVDFYFQVSNSTSSTSSLRSVNNSSYADGSTIYSTDVWYRIALEGSMAAAGFSTPTGSPVPDSEPVLATREETGSVVSFDFGGAGPTRINPGEISPILVIQTDAADFETGLTSLQNGGSANYETFEPAGPAIPEPGSMLLFGSGLFGLAALARRRFGVAAR
jgi:hypothetical protein